MSDYVSSSSSTFEHLPNELLLIIFEYLNLHFVYYGFFGLNRRFNSLLASNLKPPNIRTLHLSSKEDNPSQTFIDFFASRIIKLHINNYLADDLYDLVNFPNVRFLILENPFDEQCEQVNLHTLSHLKYLYIQGRSSSRRQTNFYFNPYNISHLYSIRIDDSYFRIQWSGRHPFLYYLHSLTIPIEESLNVYLKLLAACPNLIRLEIKLWSIQDWLDQRVVGVVTPPNI